MKLRQATLEDAPELVRFIHPLLTQESQLLSSVTFDWVIAENSFKQWINNGFVMIAEHDGEWAGIMAAVLCEFEFSADIQASERTLYVTPKYRGSRAAVMLVASFVTWAEAMGAKHIVSGTITNVSPEIRAKTARLYRGFGFKSIGEIFWRLD